MKELAGRPVILNVGDTVVVPGYSDAGEKGLFLGTLVAKLTVDDDCPFVVDWNDYPKNKGLRYNRHHIERHDLVDFNDDRIYSAEPVITLLND